MKGPPQGVLFISGTPICYTIFMERRVALMLCLTLGAIFLLHIAAIYFHWYWTVTWFDIVMHFIGGAWVGIVTLLVFAERASASRAFVYALLGALIVGLLWELYEYAAGVTFSLSAYPIDTTRDLIMDVVGGGAAFFLLRDRYTKSQ